MRIKTGRLITGAAVALLALASSPARADEQTAGGGGVEATFSFSAKDPFSGAGEMRLTIVRDGTKAYDDAPQVGDCDHYDSCGPAGFHRHSVRVRDLDGDGEPEVLLDLYWGGAHCCFFADVYRYDGTRYQSVSHNFADPGYRLGDIDGDGVPEFVSADARFAYRYTSFASSVFPIQIWSYAKGRFSDRTDRFPDRIRADADRDWALYRRALRRQDYEPRGAVAAWAADRYRLGKRRSTLETLRRLARQGRLPGTLPTDQRTFVARLDRFLRHSGYGGD